MPLACGAAVAAIAAIFALFLPATPPKAKGEPMSVADALGLRAFGMLKDRNMAVFMFCVVVWTVAFTIYWMYGSFLASLGVKNITPTLNVGQVSELAFMLLIPVAVKTIGFKNTMGLGILAMFARYILSAFAPECAGLYWGAIAVHGIIFGFFFVAAQMYIDKKASDDIKAELIQSHTAKAIEGAAQIAGATTTDWQAIFFIEAAISGALLVFFYLFFKNDVKNA